MKKIRRRAIFGAIWLLLTTATAIQGAPAFGTLFVGQGAGGTSNCPFATFNVEMRLPFAVFPNTETDGVNVAVGNVTGDNKNELVCGSGGGPHVAVINGQTLQTIFAFDIQDPAFAMGVQVATGEFTGDQTAEVVVGADAGGGPHVKILSANGQTEIASFSAFAENFRHGVRLAVADVTGDGKHDIIVGGGPGGGSEIKIINGVTRAEAGFFKAFEPTYTGGVYVGAGKLDADNRADIVVAPDQEDPAAGVPPPVTVFNGATLMPRASLSPFRTGCRRGARVTVADLNRDAIDDIVLGPGGGGCSEDVESYNGQTLDPLFAFGVDPDTAGRGSSICSGHLDGDTIVDLILGTGPGGPPTVGCYEPNFVVLYVKPPHSGFTGGVPVCLTNFTGGKTAYQLMGCGMGRGSVFVCSLPNGDFVGQLMPFGPGYTGGVVVAGVDTTGDDEAELAAGTFSGLPKVEVLRIPQGVSAGSLTPFGAAAIGGTSLTSGDLNQDGKDDLIVSQRTVGGEILVFNAATTEVLWNFHPFGMGSNVGLRVAAADFNLDGIVDVAAALGQGGAPQIKVFDGATRTERFSFFAFDPAATGGANVGSGDMNGDSTPDILVGSGPGLPAEIRFFDGQNARWLGSFSPLTQPFTGGLFPAGGTFPAPEVDLEAFSRQPNGDLSLTLRGVLGRDIGIQRSTDFGRTWEQVQSIPATGFPQTLTTTSDEPQLLIRGHSQ